jgi:hypothetical protein
MPKTSASTAPRRSRRSDTKVLNVTLDVDAVAILRLYCPPGRRGTGKLLARLLYEHHARMQVMQEQDRLRQDGLKPLSKEEPSR